MRRYCSQLVWWLTFLIITIFLLQSWLFQWGHKLEGLSKCDSFREQNMYSLLGVKPDGEMKFDRDGIPHNNGWAGANKMIDTGCWTYKTRYKPHKKNPDGRLSEVNACNAQQYSNDPERTVFLVRMASNQEWTDDLSLAMRALISELGWNQGMDIFILQHVDEPDVFTPAPAIFEPLIIRFTLAEISKDYPKDAVRGSPNPAAQIPLIAEYNHLAETWFMHEHPEYEFAWIAESDVRTTGPWDIYIPTVIAESERVAPNERIDLINFGPSWHPGREWNWASDLHQFPETNWTVCLLQLHRISRALADAMYEEHSLGHNAYFETYVPTVATHHNLTKFTFGNPVFADGDEPFNARPFFGIAGVPVNNPSYQSKNLYFGNLEEVDQGATPVLYHGATYSPSHALAKRYHDQWRTEGVCRPISLVHPVKS